MEGKAEWLVWQQRERFTYKTLDMVIKQMLKLRKVPQCPPSPPHTPTPSTSLQFTLRVVEKVNVTVKAQFVFLVILLCT